MTTTTCWYVAGAVTPWQGMSAPGAAVTAVDVVVDALVEVVDERAGARVVRGFGDPHAAATATASAIVKHLAALLSAR